MKRGFTLTAACCLLPAILLCLYLLTAGDAAWLRIETSHVAIAGEDFRVRVTLIKPEPGLYLGSDMHGMTDKGESTGYISGGKQVQVIAGKNIYEYSIPVPINKTTAYIFPVVVLSRDGNWNGRIRAADTCAIPVAMQGSRNDLVNFTNRKAREIELRESAAEPEPRLPAMAISVTWLAAAITAALSGKKSRTGWIAAAAITASLWELLSSSTILAGTLRDAAHGIGIYSSRLVPQQALTAAVIILLAAAAVYLLSSGLELFSVLAWTGIAVYSCISLLQVFSLHEIDRLLSADIEGIHAGQIFKLAAALVCLCAAGLSRKKSRQVQ